MVIRATEPAPRVELVARRPFFQKRKFHHNDGVNPNAQFELAATCYPGQNAEAMLFNKDGEAIDAFFIPMKKKAANAPSKKSFEEYLGNVLRNFITSGQAKKRIINLMSMTCHY